MITFDATQLTRLSELMHADHKKIRSEMYKSVNATAKKTVGLMARQISTELAATQKVIKQNVRVVKKADARQQDITSVVAVKKSGRLPLRMFNAKQTAGGVSYKASKTKGRRTIKSAFIPSAKSPRRDSSTGRYLKVERVPIAGGNVFKRTSASRLPIVKLYGPSPWGVFTKNDMKQIVEPQAGDELQKQLEKRIRYNVLKQAGKLNWQK